MKFILSAFLKKQSGTINHGTTIMMFTILGAIIMSGYWQDISTISKVFSALFIISLGSYALIIALTPTGLGSEPSINNLTGHADHNDQPADNSLFTDKTE